MDEIKDYKYRQAVDEPEEDEPLPPGVEDFDDVEDEDNSLIDFFKKPSAPKPQPKEEPKPEKSEADTRKWLSGLGLNALNVEMNKAIDNEDWPLAQEIQKMIERKTGGVKESFVSESLNELFIPEQPQEEPKEGLDENAWYFEVIETLINEFGVDEFEAEGFVQFYDEEFHAEFEKGSDPKETAMSIVKAKTQEDGTHDLGFDDDLDLTMTKDFLAIKENQNLLLMMSLFLME